MTRDAYLAFLVAPKLEAGIKNGKEAACYESSPGHLEPITTGVIVWLPELSLAATVGWLPGLVITDNGLVSGAGCCR